MSEFQMHTPTNSAKKTKSFKEKAIESYINYKQKHGKGYSGPEPGHISFIYCNKHLKTDFCDCEYRNLKKFHAFKSKYLKETPDFKIWDVQECAKRHHVNVRYIKIEEYVQGVQYSKIIKPSSQINMAKKVFPMIYNESIETSIISIRINDKDYTKNLKYLLGLYNFGIIDDYRTLIDTRISRLKRINANDKVSITFRDNLSLDENTKIYTASESLTWTEVINTHL